MQGCQLKQIKRSPALCSMHTWCAHRLITLCHTHTHTKMHKAAIHKFPRSLVDAGKSDQIVYHLQSSTASRPLQMCLEVKERKRVKAEGKSRQGMWEKRLVISLLAKRCENGDQWEQAELQQHSGLSARWEQGEEQRGGRPALCYREKERQAELIALLTFIVTYRFPTNTNTSFSNKQPQRKDPWK